MKEQNIFVKFKKYAAISLSLICFLFFSSSHSNINHAQIINPPNKIFYSVANKEYTYIFKISDKLVGTGEINLSVENNKIKGTALGLGMTNQCNIDFFTDIKGIVDTSEGNIKISVHGKGKPQGILLPGKVSYEGPLKGFLLGKTVTLKGDVKINGSLARLGGFRSKEDLTIEITDTSLARALSQIQNKKNLALYN